MTDWNRVASKCEDEELKASSSRSTRAGLMKYPGAKIEKLKDEQDEFRAKELAFRDIGRICRKSDTAVIEERIKRMRDNPPADSNVNDRTAYKERHWPEAFEYALKQCELEYLL